MLLLPVEVVCNCIFPHLSVCDLQALDTAFTNKCLRPQIRQVWKSYQYDSLDSTLRVSQLIWLCEVRVQIISLVLCASQQEWKIPNIPALRRLRLTSHLHSVTFLKTISASVSLVDLYINNVSGSNVDNAVSALAQNCRQLHTLHINSEELTDAGIRTVAQFCCHLSNIQFLGAQISDAGIQALCANCPHLKHIGLSYCHKLTDASLIAIANTYPKMEAIVLLRVKYVTDDGLIYFADKCHELRSVKIRCKHITSRGLTAFWAANPNLIDVDITDNRFISDDDIIQLVQYCPLLQKLNMCCCRLITDAAVIAVAEHCPQLRSLYIRCCCEVSDTSLIALGQHCHKLKSINITFLVNISDVGIAALAAGCPLLQQFYANYTNITDAGVIALARGCRDLRKVTLQQCELINFAAVSAIAKNCPLISELYLQNCKLVDDACLYVIAQNCRNLTSIRVSNTKLSAIALRAVIAYCRMLQTIHCSACFRNEQDLISMRECSRRAHVIVLL